RPPAGRHDRRDQQEPEGADPARGRSRHRRGRARHAAAPRGGVATVTPPTPDVLVIGAGVIGCAIARALARPGCSVVLVDRGAIGGEASSASAGAAGVLRVAGGPADGPRLALRRASLDRFPSLAAALRDETGADVELDLDGVVVPCLDEAAEAEQRAQIGRRRAIGLRAEWLD